MPGPDHSPTPTPISPSIRRTLFSTPTHLSRRPASQPEPAASAASNLAALPSSALISLPPTKATQTHAFTSPQTFLPSIPPSTTQSDPDAIIALHPITGRPLLPFIPTLPSHMHLSSSDDGNNNDEGDDSDKNEARLQDPDSPTWSSYDPTTTATATASASGMDVQDRLDHERIERGIADMMARRRERVEGTGQNNNTRGRKRPERNDDDGEELMGLIMASLREKVASLDEDAWMFESSGMETEAGMGG